VVGQRLVGQPGRLEIPECLAEPGAGLFLGEFQPPRTEASQVVFIAVGLLQGLARGEFVFAAAENFGHDRNRAANSLAWLGVGGKTGAFAFQAPVTAISGSGSGAPSVSGHSGSPATNATLRPRARLSAVYAYSRVSCAHQAVSVRVVSGAFHRVRSDRVRGLALPSKVLVTDDERLASQLAAISSAAQQQAGPDPGCTDAAHLEDVAVSQRPPWHTHGMPTVVLPGHDPVTDAGHRSVPQPDLR
jgi:hypothetical protein